MTTNSKRTHAILFLLLSPCLLAIIMTVLYTLKVVPALDLMVLNVLYIPFALLEFTLACVEKQNSYKAGLFASALAVGISAAYVNIQSDFLLYGDASIQSISAWSKVWLIAAAVTLFALIWIMIRLFRWEQGEWEKAKAQSQELRLHMKKAWAERIKNRGSHRAEITQLKHDYKKEAETAKGKNTLKQQQAKFDVKSAKQEAARHAAETDPAPENITKKLKTAAEHTKKDCQTAFGSLPIVLLRFILPIAIAVLFVLLPMFSGVTTGFLWWINQVKSLVDVLIPGKVTGGLDALLNYIILFVLGTGFVAVLVIIICQLFGTNFQQIGKHGGHNFSDKYGTPIAILIVAWAALMVMTSGNASIFDISGGWGNLLISILFILVLLTSVEIVRLVLDQCARDDSLLNNLLRLIFVVILEFFVSLILGVITNFRIQTIISSLFVLVFPEQNEIFQDRVNQIQDKLFHKELNDIAGLTDDCQDFKGFHKKCIWRGRKK